MTPMPATTPIPATLRACARDSQAAVARLLALAMLIDGQVDPRELGVLDRVDAFRRLRLSRHHVVQALDDLCAELMTMRRAQARGREGTQDGHITLSVEALTAVLDEVADSDLQRELLGVCFDLMHADGQVHPNESLLWRAALTRWRVPMGEVLMAVTCPFPGRLGASASYPLQTDPVPWN